MKPTGSRVRHELLPSSRPDDLSWRCTRLLSPPRRKLRRWLFVLPFLVAFATWSLWSYIRVIYANVRYSSNSWTKPPTFERFYDMERAYPQHNLSLPFPEGKDGRYVWVSHQVWGLGWNNVFQTLYLLSHMAYLSNRAFVFMPYTWHFGPEPYVEYAHSGRLIPSRIPLAAIVSGPMAGGSFPPDPQQPPPRAVNKDWFRKVCPPRRTKIIRVEAVNAELTYANTTMEVMDKYVSVLKEAKEGCIELRGAYGNHPFGWDQFGRKELLSVYPTLSKSPILQNFDWSPLVTSALRSNAALLSPKLAQQELPSVIEDLAAIHIRRGDYDVHCQHLANWSSPFLGWAQFPDLPDKFTPPPGAGWGENTPENTKIYMTHCLPDINEIVKKVREARSDWEARLNTKPLRRLYILTNGERSWVAMLKEILGEDLGWDSITSSRDLYYSFEQQYISQAIDMAISERAALFIGNGFSSLSANVILIRSVRGSPMESNRLW